MAALDVSLSPEAVGKIHDTLLCLSKFSETVCIETRRDKLLLTALNSTKSSYACFSFDSSYFFLKYHFVPESSSTRSSNGGNRFSCSVYNKALLSVFNGRLVDPRDKEAAIERCDLSIQERPQRAESRLVIRMVCRHGVIKTYRLTFEPVEPIHALFDKESVQNKWSVSSKMMRDFIEHFGPRTEQLDIAHENGRVNFTSYTEKIVHQNEILKQPLQTSVAIDCSDFEDFDVEEKMHIAISVKDFKAIIQHAETMHASVNALYSYATRPMQISYKSLGMTCEFTLMTIGDYKGSSSTQGLVAAATPRSRQTSTTPTTASATSTAVPERRQSRPAFGEMAPPERPPPRPSPDKVSRDKRPSPPPPQPSVDSQSLFLPYDEDDHRWGEANYEQDEEEMLTWDASVNNGTSNGFTRSAQDSNSPRKGRKDPGTSASTSSPRIAPTQKLSQVHGLFDD